MSSQFPIPTLRILKINNLIEFYTMAVKSVLESQEETKEFVIDDKNF